MTDQVEKRNDVPEMIAKIFALEAGILSTGKNQKELFPIEHFFAPGIYLRKMTMPKDSLVTGKIHKTEHYCILAKGEVSVANEHGTTRLKAPQIIHSMPGTKRALVALDEVVWINVHHNPTDEKDLDKIEAIFTANSIQEYLDHKAQVEPGLLDTEVK